MAMNQQWLSLELDDDPATLRAALAMIDALEETHAPESPVGSSPSQQLGRDLWPSPPSDSTDPASTSVEGQSSPTRTEVLGIAANATGRYRKSTQAMSSTRAATKRAPTRREEILRLRDSVTQLEQTLDSLKRRRTDASLSSDGSVNDLTLATVWEELAMRQYRQRHAAERENERLRKMLGNQISVGQQLVELVRKTEQENPFNTNSVPISSDKVQSMTEEQQIAKMDMLFVEAERVFAKKRFNQGSMTFRDMKVTDTGPSCTLVETQVSWVVPFELQSVRESLWSISADPSSATKCNMNNRAVQINEDMTIVSFQAGSLLCLDKMPTNVAGRVVVKRFPDGENRNAMIVTSMYAKLVGSVEDTYELVTMHDDSWLRVHEAPTSGQEDGTPVVQVQCSRRITLTFACDYPADRRRIESAVTELVLSQVEDTLIWKQQMLENMLLPETQQQRDRATL